MSGTPSWARMAESTNSTMEWTMLWGWIRTSICSGRRLKRWWASMISRALFIRVAESMVIFLPHGPGGMGQRFFHPDGGEIPLLILEKRSARSGQYHPAHMLRGLEARHWKMALCSLSMGMISARRSAQFAVDQFPGRHQGFLVGQAQPPLQADGLQRGRQAGRCR